LAPWSLPAPPDLSVSRSPPGAVEAAPSLVARTSLLSPGAAAPSGSLTTAAPLVRSGIMEAEVG